MKARAAWQHEALSQAGNVHFFSDEGWAGAQRASDCYRGNPTSPASHTYWTVALSPNPSESQTSQLTAPPPALFCYGASATGATGSH